MNNFIIKTFRSAQGNVDELVLQQSNYDIILLCGLDSDFLSSKGRGLILITTGSTCLDFSLLIYFLEFWENIELDKY